MFLFLYIFVSLSHTYANTHANARARSLSLSLSLSHTHTHTHLHTQAAAFMLGSPRAFLRLSRKYSVRVCACVFVCVCVQAAAFSGTPEHISALARDIGREDSSAQASRIALKTFLEAISGCL
jgi:hypothetical protein